MGVHSGKFGVVNGQSAVRNWTISDSQTLIETIASNTKFGKVRTKGVNDWTGSFAGNGALPAVLPGETFDFEGYTAPQNDVSGAGIIYSGPAIVDSVAIVWNWTINDIIKYTVNFSANGGLDVDEPGSALDYDEDASTVLLLPSAAALLQYSTNGSAYTTWTNLLQATLTISAANLSYVNSSTIDVGGLVQTFRKAGNIDWTLAVQEEDNSRAKVIKGTNYYLKLFADDTDFWQLNFGRVRDYSGLNVDRESGAILQQTVNLDMTGFLDDGTEGQITAPGAGSNYWPTY